MIELCVCDDRVGNSNAYRGFVDLVFGQVYSADLGVHTQHKKADSDLYTFSPRVIPDGEADGNRSKSKLTDLNLGLLPHEAETLHL